MAYKVLGWVVWQVGLRVARRKIGSAGPKLAAGGAVALVLVLGFAAAKASSSDD